MKFRDLPTGAVFEFDHSKLPPGHGLARGPWIKTSPRKYRHQSQPGEYVVGSINVEVTKKGANKNG